MQRPGSHQLIFKFKFIFLAAFTNAAFTQIAHGHLLEPKNEPPGLLDEITLAVGQSNSCKNIHATPQSHPSDLDHPSPQSAHSLLNLISSSDLQRAGVKPHVGSSSLCHQLIQMHGSSSKVDTTTDLTMGNSMNKKPLKLTTIQNEKLASNSPGLVEPSGSQDDAIYPEENFSFHECRKNSIPSRFVPSLPEQQPLNQEMAPLAYENGYLKSTLIPRADNYIDSPISGMQNECLTQNLLERLGKPSFNPSSDEVNYELPDRTFIDTLGVGDGYKQRPCSSSNKFIYKENQNPSKSLPDFHHGNVALCKSYGVPPLLDLSKYQNFDRNLSIPEKTASSIENIMAKESSEAHVSNLAFQKHQIPPNHFGESLETVVMISKETMYAHGLRNSDDFQIGQSSHDLEMNPSLIKSSNNQAVDGQFESDNAQICPKCLKRKSPDLTEARRDCTHQKIKPKNSPHFSIPRKKIKLGNFGPFGNTKASYINASIKQVPQEPIRKLVSNMKMTSSDHPEKYRNLNIYLYGLNNIPKRINLQRLTFKANSFKRKHSLEATKFHWESVLKLIKPEDKGRLIMKPSEFQIAALKFHRMLSSKVEKMSREEKYSFYRSKTRVFEESKDTWFDYWSLQTNLNFKVYCESRIPSEYQDVFPLFLYHVEMIRAIIPLPEEQGDEYTQKMAEACQFFEDLAKQKKENLEYLRTSKYGSRYLWDFLEPWIKHYSPTVWNQMSAHNGDLSAAKGFINKIFLLSVDNLTEHYKKLI